MDEGILFLDTRACDDIDVLLWWRMQWRWYRSSCAVGQH